MENIIWTIFICFILYLSITLMIKQKFISFNFIKLIKSINSKNLVSLSMFLGSKIGVGSLIGITISLCLAGPSSLIWMIIFSLLSSPIVYEEAILGFKNRKMIDGTYISGPQYYIKNKKLKIFYLLTFIIAYSFFFLMIQTNSISELIHINIFVNKWIIFIFFLILLTILLIIDLKSIISILDKLVISMIIFCFILFGFAIIKNLNTLPYAISYIFKDFFKTKNIFYGIIPSVIIIIKKCIFQSELLLGTTGVSAALSYSNEEESGCAQVLGYYIVTIIMPTLLTILITIFRIQTNFTCINYLAYLSLCFTYHYGKIGILFLVFLFLLFGLTTIIGIFYSGINNVKKYFKNYLNVYKIIMLSFALCGILISEGYIWKFVDYSMLLLMIINSLVIYKLRR